MHESEDTRVLEEKVGCVANNPAFSTTHWSVVLTAVGGDSVASEKALESLCRLYWYPLYAFIRRRGSTPEHAEDLTQAFFAHLLEKEALKTVAKEKGKFRTFLLAALTNFLTNEHQRSQRQKRGGRVLFESWDQMMAEERYGHEPVENITPERLFERRCAYTLVEQALSKLRQEYKASSKSQLFEHLHALLTADSEPGVVELVASRLKMSTGAVKVALHRMRRRFGENLRSEIAATVASPDQVDDELRYLFSVIGT